MEKHLINELLLDPSKIKTTHIGEIWGLLSKHPWFALGVLVTLRNLKDNDHSEFDIQYDLAKSLFETDKAAPIIFNEDIRRELLVLEAIDKGVLTNERVIVEDFINQAEIIDNFTSFVASGGDIRIKLSSLSKEEELEEAHPLEGLDDESNSYNLPTLDNDATLANAEFHIKNGDYEKGIAIFDHLILKYPEKKSYFVSRMGYLLKKI